MSDKHNSLSASATKLARGPRVIVDPSGSTGTPSQPNQGPSDASALEARDGKLISVLRPVGIHSAKIDSYIDTVEAFFRTVPIGLRKEVERLHGKRCRIRVSRDKSGRRWGYRLCINQPGADVLIYLAGLEKQGWCRLSRVDVAYDFLATSRQQAEPVARRMEQRECVFPKTTKKSRLRGTRLGASASTATTIR